MAFKKELKCNDCGNLGAMDKKIRTGDNTTALTYICKNCFIKRMRKAPNWFNIRSIQDELNEIVIMNEYLNERSNGVILPFEDCFNWIKEESWDKLSEFRLELGKKVLQALKENMNEFISEFEKIPSKVLEPEQFRSLRKFIHNKREWSMQIEGDGDNAVNWIKRVKKTIDGSKELLEEFQHSWERFDALTHPKDDFKNSFSLKGIQAFISGRLTDLKNDRDAAKQYLESIDIHVLRFEDFASTNTPENACLEMVNNAQIYIGIYGVTYGNIVSKGKSATELEFDEATLKNKIRLIFIKKGEPEIDQKQFFDRIKQWDSHESVLYKSYSTIEELKKSLQTSLNELLKLGVLKQIQG